MLACGYDSMRDVNNMICLPARTTDGVESAGMHAVKIVARWEGRYIDT